MKRNTLILFPLFILSAACDAPEASIVHDGSSGGTQACPDHDPTGEGGSGTGGPAEPGAETAGDGEGTGSGGGTGTGDAGGTGGDDGVEPPPDEDPGWTSPEIVDRVAAAAGGELIPGLSAGPILVASDQSFSQIGATNWRVVSDFDPGRLWIVGRDADAEVVFLAGIEPRGQDSAELAVVRPDFARITLDAGKVAGASLASSPELMDLLLLVATDFAAPGDEILSTGDGACDSGVFGWLSCGLGATAAVAGCITAGAGCAATGGLLCPVGGVACGAGAGKALCHCAEQLDKGYGC